VQINFRSIAGNTLKENIGNIFSSGQTPKYCLFSLVKASAVIGSFEQNPFYFEHCLIRSLQISVGTQNFPVLPYETGTQILAVPKFEWSQ